MKVDEWKDKPIADFGSVTSPDFKKFAKDVKKEIKSMAAKENLQLYDYLVGHYYISGILKDDTSNKYSYFNISDVRFNKSWYDQVLIRNMKHERDYTGEQNHYTTFDKLCSGSRKLIEDKIMKENQQNNKGGKSMDINVNNVSNGKNNICGDVVVNNQSYKFDYNKETQDVKVFNEKNGVEIPLPQSVTDNIVPITDSIKDKIGQSKELPIPPEKLGSYRVPSDKAEELDKLLKEKRIQHIFSDVKNNQNEKYVLFDKKFYPGVKAALSKLQIRKPSLSEQIAEAKSNSANRSTSANQRDFANDITRG